MEIGPPSALTTAFGINVTRSAGVWMLASSIWVAVTPVTAPLTSWTFSARFVIVTTMSSMFE